MNLILFPNQLLDPKHLKPLKFLPKETTVYFIEDPCFYGDRKGSGAVESLKLNQLRILYMYVSHQRYLKTLKEAGYKVIYKSVQDLWKKNIIDLPKHYHMIDPCDLLVSKRYQPIKTMDSPSFVMTLQDLKDYRGTKTTRFQHSDFYKTVKDKLNLLKNIPSQDAYNREPYRKTMPLPISPFQHLFGSKTEWQTGVQWLQKSIFQNNPKPSLPWDTLIDTYLVHLPLTSKDVHVWLNDFLKHRLNQYGPYQDVVLSNNPLLYHSGLSIYLNNGMITPLEVVEALRKKKTALPNYEGFVRQIIGWREYCRLYYLFVTPKEYRQNIFQLKKKLNKEWYQGTTDIPIVNDTIQYAFNYGYINHIQRLMIMANYMTLSNIHPDGIYQWMYEFSLDSYEWVMIFNCYSMGSWSDGGLAMRKPYISSSNYVLKMSDAKKGPWVDVWNARFKDFLQNHASILKHTQLANLVS